MGAVASQITSLTIVYSTIYSDADQSKHQSSASLAFVRGIHRGPVNSPHKWPVTRKMFPFDDVIIRSKHQSIWIEIRSVKKMYMKMPSAKWRSFCLGLSPLMAFYLNQRWLICNRPVAQIQQCTCPIPHNVPFRNGNAHISVIKWCIVGYLSNALWDCNHAPAFYRARWLAKVTRRV